MYIARLKDNDNQWVLFACDKTGPADESKRTKRVQKDETRPVMVSSQLVWQYTYYCFLVYSALV